MKVYVTYYYVSVCFVFIIILNPALTSDLMPIISLLLAQMADVDPETLLEWLSMGQGDERDMQLIALEQLCMLLLMSDNVDRCFEWYIRII